MNLEEYYNNIYRYCYLHTQNRHTAEDLTQETFLKFLETSNYQDRGKPLAFLYTIARNLCIDHIRQDHGPVPFLALATVTEAGYSARCGMEEPGTFHAVFPACGPLCKARHPGSSDHSCICS